MKNAIQNEKKLQKAFTSIPKDIFNPAFTEIQEIEDIKSSTKMIVLMDLIEQCVAINEKLLIFSAFTEVLDIIESYIKENYQFYRIDGKTNEKSRFQQICEFNDRNNYSKQLFLLSTRAGGEGINLTGGNRMVLMDVSFNPSIDCKYPF